MVEVESRRVEKRMRSSILIWLACIVALGLLAPPTVSQEAGEEAESDSARLWSGRGDLGLSLTEGNSATETISVRADVRRRDPRSTFRLRLEGLESDTADDRLRQVDPGFTFLPGEMPPADSFTSSLVEPGIEPDVENYFLEALYERTVSREPRLGPGTFNWHVGVSWDRNVDAGLIGRTVTFAGVGHDWWNRDDLQFRTRYSLSYTDRNERSPDPEKDDGFGGVRVSWFYRNQWGPRLVYENDWTFNMSLSDSQDYSASMIQTVDVPVNKRWSLVVGLQWLFNNLPALEDVDLVAEVALVDPDGVPGSGDEFFQTVQSGGTTIEIDTVRVRKKTLDTVFSTSLRVTF